MINQVRRLMAPYLRLCRMMVARGVVKLINDSLKMQEVQITLLADEVKADVERFQNYGLTSHPLPGAEAAVMFVGGSRDHGMVIAIDDRRYRLKGLAAGEVALYDDLGQKVHLKRDMIDVDSPTKIKATAPNVEIIASAKVTMTTPLLEVSGNITAGGNINDSVRSMAADREIYNAHTHPNGGMPSGQQ